MPSHERVNITPLARRVREHGLDTASTDQPSQDVAPNSPEASKIWSSIKPELYALISIFTDRVVDSVLEERPTDSPFGLVDFKSGLPLQHLDEGLPFVDFGARVRETIYKATDKDSEKIKNGKFPDVYDAYMRTTELLERTAKLNQGRATKTSPAVTIKHGSNTAVEVMAGVLTLPLEFSTDPEEQILLARNSFPLVARLAMMQGVVAVTALESLKSHGFLFSPFNPNFFDIKDIGGKPQFVLSESGEEIIEHVEKAYDKTMNHFQHNPEPIAGCPAMVNFGEGSAVQRLWDWHLDVASLVYPQFGIKFDIDAAPTLGKLFHVQANASPDFPTSDK